MANMISLPLVFAPNKIFKQIAQPVEVVNDDIRKLVDQMFNTIPQFGIRNV